MPLPPPLRLARIVRDIDSGRTTPEAVVRGARERIDALDGEIGAFAHLAPAATIDAALAAAGPLRGVPLGVKDIFDTFDMPTEHGSPIYAGNRPRADAALVAMARARGAAILGKTVTTEFAALHPAATRNPHNFDHTPGGSSSGSAAAVAAGMLAASFGSQTGGSMIRPASFCGVAGFKPSFRLLPTVGMKTHAWSLDTAGLFAASVDDVALLAAILTGRDLATTGEPFSGIRFGLYRSAVDDRLEPEMRQAWETAARKLEADRCRIADIAEPAALAEAREAQGVVQSYEAAIALGHERTHHRDALSARLRETLGFGASLGPEEYDRARRIARVGRKAATGLFETVDALLVPSALGAAPEGFETTGNPVMNKLWTLTGNPCVNVPGLIGTGGLPLGLTVVTRFGRDREALAIARFVESVVAPEMNRT